MGGEDEDLKTHRDDSDLTLNLCLGRRFQGADVYFHEAPQRGSCCACSREPEEVDEEYAYPHPASCRYCTFRYQHVPGTAIFHMGRHVHGVSRLESGERANLIVWARYRPYPPEI